MQVPICAHALVRTEQSSVNAPLDYQGQGLGFSSQLSKYQIYFECECVYISPKILKWGNCHIKETRLFLDNDSRQWSCWCQPPLEYSGVEAALALRNSTQTEQKNGHSVPGSDMTFPQGDIQLCGVTITCSEHCEKLVNPMKSETAEIGVSHSHGHHFSRDINVKYEDTGKWALSTFHHFKALTILHYYCGPPGALKEKHPLLNLCSLQTLVTSGGDFW